MLHTSASLRLTRGRAKDTSGVSRFCRAFVGGATINNNRTGGADGKGRQRRDASENMAIVRPQLAKTEKRLTRVMSLRQRRSQLLDVTIAAMWSLLPGRN